jgi:hypothetical protein
MYQTSEEGIRKIRRDLLRQTSLEQLESRAVLFPGMSETEFNLLKEAFENAASAREDFLKNPDKYKSWPGYEVGCF